MKTFLKIFLLLLFLLPSKNAIAENALIVEGRVWEYVETYENVFTHEYNLKFSKYGFTGSTTKFGKEYSQWSLIQEENCSLTEASENNNWEIETVQHNQPIALLREDSGVIYMLLEKSTVSTFNPETREVTERKTENAEEAILYDFNVALATRFEMLYNANILTECLVKEVSEVEINGNKLKSYSVITDYECYELKPEDNPDCFLNFVETVGNIGEGTLTSIYTTAYYPVPPNGEINKQGFNALYDINGDVLFKGMGISNPASITDVLATQVEDSKLYDLHGREVTNPLPGSIYIRDGKKFIAK